MRLRLTVALLLALAALAGCGGSSSRPAGGGEESGGGPLVTYVKSGGIAGISEKLEIAPSGRARVSQGLAPTAKVTSFSVPEAELSALRRSLDAAGLAGRMSVPPQGCADCFVYDITYAETHFRGNEATLAPAVRPAVTKLNQLLARAGIEEPLGTAK